MEGVPECSILDQSEKVDGRPKNGMDFVVFTRFSTFLDNMKGIIDMVVFSKLGRTLSANE